MRIPELTGSAGVFPGLVLLYEEIEEARTDAAGLALLIYQRASDMQ
jgi:hypothetical protein